jgi:hypothetical protein
MLYGCEEMSHDANGYAMLIIWNGGISRKICGPISEQGVSRNRSDKELLELYDVSDLVADIRRKRLQWLETYNHSEWNKEWLSSGN